MKVSCVFALVIFVCSMSFGQIKYDHFGQVFPENAQFFEDIGSHKSAEEVGDPLKQKLMLGIRNTDTKSIADLLSPKLQQEVDVIDSVLNIYEAKYNALDSVFLFENLGFAFSQEGYVGITKFSQKSIGSFTIEYQYCVIDKRPVINQLKVSGSTFPTELSRVTALKSLVRRSDQSAKEKFDAYSELLSLIGIDEGKKMNAFCILESKQYLATLNGNLSWYALNIGENEIAVSAARKALELNPSKVWASTNLALALTQLGRLDEAFEIYRKYKDRPYRNGKMTYKDVFLKDIKDVEASGITITHKDKIIEVLSTD